MATEERDAPLEAGWPPWVALWILPYVRETMLWPVLIALLGHVWVAVGGLLIALFRDGQMAAAKWVVLSVVISLVPVAVEVRAIRRLGAVTAVVVGSWLMSVFLAWLAHTTGVY